MFTQPLQGRVSILHAMPGTSSVKGGKARSAEGRMERSMRKTSPRRGGLGVVASMGALAFQRRRQWFLLW
jgi:hypothetical protein